MVVVMLDFPVLTQSSVLRELSCERPCPTHLVLY